MVSGIKVVGRRALIGRGFLGSTLDKPGRFTDRYHSKNIDQLGGQFDLIVVAAPGGEKWRANNAPAADWDAVAEIMAAIDHTSSCRLVLLSTIDATRDHPYGWHRRGLEEYVTGRYGAVIRLPALYGPGLKKNALFDLLTGRRVANQVYHWYNVARLWEDVWKAQPGLWCPYSAPLSMWKIAERLGFTEQVTMQRDPTKDYNEKGPFTMTSEEALEDIVRWVKSVSL